MRRLAFASLIALFAARTPADGLTYTPPPFDGSFTNSVDGVVYSVPRVSAAAVTYYVNTATGSDSNNCTSAATPCLTAQVVCDKVPFEVRHNTLIRAVGTFSSGFCRLENRIFDATSATNGTWVLITTGDGSDVDHQGFTTVTPATGSATGTFTSFVAAAAGANTRPVFTDSGATWTVNDYAGKFLEISGGACGDAGSGNGFVSPIISNTATTITITGVLTSANQVGCTPDNTSQYKIRDVSNTTLGAAITGSIAPPKGGPGNIAQLNTDSSALGGSYAFFLSNNTKGTTANTAFTSSWPPGSIYITRFAVSVAPIFAGDSNGIIYAQNKQTGNGIINFKGTKAAAYDNTVVKTTASSVFINADAADRSSFGSVISTYANYIVPGVLIRSGSGVSMISNRADYVSGNTAIAVQIMSGRYIGQHLTILPGAAECLNFGVPGGTPASGYGFAEVSELYCSGYTTGFGIQATGNWVVQSASLSTQAWTIAGAASSVGSIRVLTGAKVLYPNGSTMTCNGGATACLSVESANAADYFTDASLIIAGRTVMSAASGASISNTNGGANIGGVGPWVSYYNSGAGFGSMLKLGESTTAGLPTPSVVTGESTIGGLYYNGTLGCITASNGVTWACLPRGAPSMFPAYLGGVATLVAANKDFAVGTVTQASTLVAANFTSQAVGIGAGTFQVDLCNGAGACAVSFANVVVACTSAQGALTAGTITTAAIPAGTVPNWRVTADACTANATAYGIANASFTTP